MIELERHIEILLLSNDCVIVPGLGGFMTHHVDARYDERDHVFLPPLRTLGFNPQLNINDSLLVQSYIEAYDISYPEALQRIDDEVNELRQHVENEGSYELNDIGVLALNEDGNYVFTPCEAGILTPALYGLSSFEIFPLNAKAKQTEPVAIEKPESVEEPTAKVVGIDSAAVTTEEPVGTDIEEEEEADVIRIKYAWVRNAVAVAAILIAVLILTLPTGKTNMMQQTISNLNNGLLFGMMSEDTNTSKIEIQKKVVPALPLATEGTQECEIRKENALKADSALIASADSASSTNLKQLPENNFCIVLASHVSMRNANSFIERLQKQGYNQAEVFVRNNITRVVYGHYPSEEAAQDDLRRFHRQRETAEAWVMKQ